MHSWEAGFGVRGNAFYGNKGFTVDLGHPKALCTMMDYMINNAVLTAEQHQRAIDFLFFDI